MNPEKSIDSAPKRLGVLVGGSGLIGGYLTYYFKVKAKDTEIRAPNSKKLSLRNVDDIKGYFAKHRPDFVINCAIAAIDSDAHMAYEVNYMGSVNLARGALALGIPYIHVSSAVTLPAGEDLTEDDHLPLSQDMSNYAKSKLMTEMTLRHMHESLGLDYTIIRLAIVYGEHDHKIQGVQRLLFSIVDRAMPFMLTKKGIRHSYSNANKLPYFIDHILSNREEFSGEIYHFVDHEPVELCRLILTLKSYMELNVPKEIYIPYSLAKMGSRFMHGVVKILGRVGIKASVPAELMFLGNFYRTQTLSAEKLRKSSFVDPAPHDSIFSELPALIEYYLARWEHLNLFSTFSSKDFVCPHNRSEEFLKSPKKLMEQTHNESIAGFEDID